MRICVSSVPESTHDGSRTQGVMLVADLLGFQKEQESCAQQRALQEDDH